MPHKAGKIGHGPKQIGHEAVLVASEGQKMVHEAEKVSHKALKLVVQFRARVKFGCDVQSSMVRGKIAVVKSEPKTIRQVIISAHGL